MMAFSNLALAEKSVGILRIYHRDSLASMSIHEEGSHSSEIPMTGVFNNLVVFDQPMRRPFGPLTLPGSRPKSERRAARRSHFPGRPPCDTNAPPRPNIA
jgi:hypothetical protein